MRLLKILATLIVVSVVCFVSAAEHEYILKKRASVSSKLIKLSDVIENSGLLPDKIADTVIDSLAFKSVFKNIHSKNVQIIMRSKYNAELEIKNSVCVVKRSSRRLSKQEIDNSVADFIKSRFGKYSKFEYKVHTWPDIEVPEKDFTIVYDLPRSPTFSDNIILKGNIMHESERISGFSTRISLSVFDNVFVAKRRIKRNAQLDMRALTMEVQPVSINSGYINDINEIEGRIASKYIRPGAVITSQNTKIIPDVSRGETAMVEVKSSSVKLVINAVAKKDGYIGEKIKFENPDSNESFMAVISGRKQAVIEMGEQ